MTKTERDQAICQAYQGGNSMSAIAKAFELSRTQISHILRQSGVPKRIPKMHREKPEYRIWHATKTRCYNPNYPEYGYYGGRGITMCDRWKDSFEAFYEDMGPKPSPYHSLERVDHDKGYSKENCRWATRNEQDRNKRNNVFITAFSETKCLVDWVRDPRCNVSQPQLRLRIKNGMSPEEAITKPSQMSRFKSETHKQCSRCKQIKPRSEFNIHRPNAREKHKAICKACQRSR